ncbi:MAG TPA: hypothetical protein VGE77_00035, partial [Nocardioides sp.]
ALLTFLGVVLALAALVAGLDTQTARAATPGVAVVAAGPATGAAVQARQATIDPYARYEPQTACTSIVRTGTRAFVNQLTARYGGRIIGITRACNQGGRSEHKESRAVDWAIDARNASQRQQFYRFFNEVTATVNGHTDARARMQGIMYIIWNDRIWAAWNDFEPRPYLHASCTSVAKCSPTLRHVDHVHISLSWDGANGATSWYR